MSWMKCICPGCTNPDDHEVPIPESDFDELIERIQKLKAALERIRDCNFVITLPDRMDAVRAIAREALTTTEESSALGATDKDSLTVGSIS